LQKEKVQVFPPRRKADEGPWVRTQQKKREGGPRFCLVAQRGRKGREGNCFLELNRRTKKPNKEKKIVMKKKEGTGGSLSVTAVEAEEAPLTYNYKGKKREYMRNIPSAGHGQQEGLHREIDQETKSTGTKKKKTEKMGGGCIKTLAGR